jgi:thiamine-phosphate pyrophosphorylase
VGESASQQGFPRLYPIVDAGVLAARGLGTSRFVEELRAAAVLLLQYRNKSGGPQEVLRSAIAIRELMAGSACRLIMNDRVDLAMLAEFGGVHVGQGDLSPEDARRVVGIERWVGVSTHNDEQIRVMNETSADYIAVGPVFATETKLDAEPVIGLDGVRRARRLTTKPIVAIGGITRANARSVVDAGADSVAVISALLVNGETVEKVARDFIEILR